MGRAGLILCVVLACAGGLRAQPPEPPAGGADLWGLWLHGRDAFPPPEDAPLFPGCWAQGQALVWGVKSAPLRTPLVVAHVSPPLDAPLVGGRDVSLGTFAGGRAAAGVWFDGPWHPGFEVAVFALGQRTERLSAASNDAGGAQLERPVLDAGTLQAATVVVSAEGLQSGRVDVAASSQLWGAEANGRLAALAGDVCRVEALAGFRYLGLRERLTITQGTLGLGVPIVTGGFGVVPGFPVFRVVDLFHCQNDFYGPQVGLRAEVLLAPCWFAASGKVAPGAAEQLLRIDGSTTFSSSAPGVGLVAPGGQVGSGLLAGPGNIGSHRRGRFAVVGEGTLEAGVQLCSCVELSVGYTFLYWSGVLRPGDQIDPRVNLTGFPLSPAYVPGVPSPAFPTVILRERDFWAQGVTVGVMVVF
jgi:hypothetical protein